MRKVLKVVLFCMLAASVSSQARAFETGRSDKSVFKKILQTEARGLLNIAGLPAELIRTPVVEAKMHRWLWPVTFVPRFINNLLVRSISAVYDIAFYPFILPFNGDTTPLTDPMGLSEYPWQIKEYDF